MDNTLDEVISALKTEVQKFDSQRKCALAWGVPEQNLSEQRKGTVTGRSINKMGMVHISTTRDYKPGDLAPENPTYNEFVAWSEVQYKAGIRQKECGRCSKWKTPQELTDIRDTFKASKTKFGKQETFETNKICLKCTGKVREKSNLFLAWQSKRNTQGE